MKSFGYYHQHAIQDFNLIEIELPTPLLRDNDLLVRVKAVSVNPIDYKIRQRHSSENDTPVILGWDVAGVVEQVGKSTKGFNIGDEVYYAGDLNRPGGNAEFQAVDHRLAAHKPKSLSFIEAAALPLTAITAWEALLERNYFSYTHDTKVLIIGSGGVGLMAIQVLKAKTDCRVIATSSRDETRALTQKMGADLIINHKNGLREELDKAGVGELDLVFSTTHSDQYLKHIPSLLRPFGHFVLIDDPGELNITSFKQKSLSVHWELMFTKSLFNYQLETQGHILAEVAALIDSGKMKSTANLVLDGLTIAHLKEAHETLESGQSIGKIVIRV
ncbi:MAG: zinc-binding alcohol dehydrogenase family protein [Gammaproteobacteria bacterium]|nr:zinc-binding alcohol dehydrogenase family protein [Gammaproteobacteria bacterium]